MLNNQHLHKYMIHSPATVLLIVRKCWRHIAVVDINLEVLGRPLHVGEGAPDGVEVEDDAPEHHAHDVSADTRTQTLATHRTRIFLRRFWTPVKLRL
jgi:hypothetical protein